MGLKIGVVGAGQFAKSFVPLFQAHPFVEEVRLAELVEERRRHYKERFELTRTYTSLDELCDSDVDAVAIFTQRHLHGPQTLQALRAGKHVYCAVPMATSIDDVGSIISEVEKTGLIYMTGETSYYYPSTVYCRDRFEQGDFGRFVYGESQYLHDMSHGFYDAYQYSGGDNWKQVAGIPPMFYPTHTVSMILSVTGARATHVACLGYSDDHEDGIFREGGNLWDNPFSNQTALVRTSDGGICRFNEFRRVGWGGYNSVYMSMFGTHGSYEEHAGGSAWSSLEWGEVENLTEHLACKDVSIEEASNLHKALQRDFHLGVSKAHHVERLPKSFKGKPNGHLGSHQFLVDDFVKALHTKQLPPNHVWDAAKYCVPGLIAHESAKREGEMMEIPDLSLPPASWDRLNPYKVVADH